MNFQLTQPALVDLEEIWFYTYHTWGLDQADAYIDGLMIRLAQAAGMPEIWRDRSELAADLFSFAYRRHDCFCRIHNEKILVLRILHDSSDFQRHYYQDSADTL